MVAHLATDRRADRFEAVDALEVVAIGRLHRADDAVAHAGDAQHEDRVLGLALGADRRLRQSGRDERLLEFVAGRRVARRELDPQLFTRFVARIPHLGLPEPLVDRRVDRGDRLGLEQGLHPAAHEVAALVGDAVLHDLGLFTEDLGRLRPQITDVHRLVEREQHLGAPHEVDAEVETLGENQRPRSEDEQRAERHGRAGEAKEVIPSSGLEKLHGDLLRCSSGWAQGPARRCGRR